MSVTSQNYQKIAIAVGAIAASLGAIAAPATATSLQWGVSFFDAAGTQVGTGEFSYDPDQTTFVQTSPDIPSPLPATGFNVNTALESFAATILGKTWGQSDTTEGVSWLDPTEGLKQQRFAKSPVPFIADGWFLGDKFMGTQTLLLGGKALANDTWGGSWSQIIAAGYPNKESGNGTWLAALHSTEGVPEPTTILGAITFGVGCLIRKQLSSAKATAASDDSNEIK